MGKSAKVHKRVPKKAKSNATASAASTATSSSSRTQVQASKKHSALKEKASKNKGSSTISREGGVLGGADYLALLTGSRKKIAEEAKKLPRDESKMAIDA